MDEVELTLLIRRVKKAFGLYLRRSGYGKKTLSIHLSKIFRDWIGLPTWREQFRIDDLEPHEYMAVQDTVLGDIRCGWTQKAQETKAKNKKRQAKAEQAARQITMNF